MARFKPERTTLTATPSVSSLRNDRAVGSGRNSLSSVPRALVVVGTYLNNIVTTSFRVNPDTTSVVPLNSRDHGPDKRANDFRN